MRKYKYVIIYFRVTPVFATEVEDPKESVSFGLIVGSILFGIGWAFSGLCTGPVYAMVPLTNLKIPFYWGLSCFVGMKIGQFIAFLAGKIFRRKQKK